MAPYKTNSDFLLVPPDVLVCVHRHHDTCLMIIVSPVPTASPQNVQATPLSSTAFSLTWQPPPVDRQNGIILGYFINMTELDTGRHTQLIANTTSLSVNTGLHPFYRYHFVIAAETVIGRGPPSREHLARTLEDGIYVTS